MVVFVERVFVGCGFVMEEDDKDSVATVVVVAALTTRGKQGVKAQRWRERKRRRVMRPVWSDSP